MGKTSIEWTDRSVNPIRARLAGRVGHHCEKVSAGCSNCYSSTMQRRFGMPPFEAGKRAGVEHFFDEARLFEVNWRRTPTKWFWCDMSDLFGAWVPDEWIDRCIAVMAWTARHTHQLLTKRADRMLAYSVGMARLSRKERASRLMSSCGFPVNGDPELDTGNNGLDWPLPNVWLGVSVEDQATADERIPLLLQTPAAARFVSYEPALGPVDFTRYFGDMTHFKSHPRGPDECELRWINWLIVGGESGPQARPCNVEWIRSAVRQCAAAGTPCFVKQLGARPLAESVDDVSDIVWRDLDAIDPALVELPFIGGLRSRKGGDPEEWPEDLRVREFPEVTA